MTTSESVIEEIRASRRRMSLECGHDISKLIEHIRSFEPQYAKQVEEYRKKHPNQSKAEAAAE